MPRSRSTIPRPAAPAGPEVPLDEWGVRPEPEVEDELGAPPPPPVAGKAAEPSPSEFADCPPPPEDSLAASKWAFNVLMKRVHAVMQRTMPADERDSKIVMFMREARGFMTDAARLDYMKMRAEDKRQLEVRKRRGRANAKAEPAPPVPQGANVVPIRRGGNG